MSVTKWGGGGGGEGDEQESQGQAGRRAKTGREKRGRKKEEPHGTAWPCVRKANAAPTATSFSLGNATERSPAQFTRQKAQSGHTQPSPRSSHPDSLGGRWHPGQQHQLWSDSLAPSLATVGPGKVSAWASASSPDRGTFHEAAVRLSESTYSGLPQCLACNS